MLKTLLEKDKNVVAREKGLAALFVYVDRYKFAKRQVTFITPILLTPDFIGGRLSTQQLCVKILLCLVEIDVPEPVVEALLSAASHKLAKVVAPSIGVIKNIVKIYGTQFFPTKKVLAAMLPWFEHSDKEVRRETYELTQALGHWVGAKAMEKHVSTLRDVQVKELAALLNALPTEPPKASALYRSQAEKQQAQQQAQQLANNNAGQKKPTGGNGGSEGKTPNKRERALSTSSDAPENESDRSFASAVPVEVLAKIEASPFYDMMASTKWQDRKDHLEILIGVLDVPRMKPGSYHQLGSALQKGLSDVNVKVVELSAKAIGLLARGLRTGFAPVASWIMPPILEKFKEKKAAVVQALHEALAFLVPGCLPLADVIELLRINSIVKVPQVKENLLKFMSAVFEVSSKSVLNKQLAPLMAIMLPLIDDGDSKVRDGACHAIGRLMAHVGEQAVAPKYLGKVDKSKLQKMTDAAKMAQDESNTTTSNAASQSDSSTSSPSHLTSTQQDATMDYTAMIPYSNTANNTQQHPNNTTTSHHTSSNLTASHTNSSSNNNMTGNIPSTTTSNERRKTGERPQPRNEYSSKPPNSTHNTGNYDNLLQKSRIGVNGEERKPNNTKPDTKATHKTPSPPANESKINHYANANTPKPVESKAEMMRRQQLERERMEQQELREKEARENRMREEQRRQRELEMEEERQRVLAQHEAETQRMDKLRLEQQLAEQRAELERLEQRHQLEQQRLEKQIALMKKQQSQQQQMQLLHQQQQTQQPASYHPPLSVSTSTSALTNTFGLRSMQSLIGDDPQQPPSSLASHSNKENSSRYGNQSLKDGGMLDLNETFKSLSLSSSSSDFGNNNASLSHHQHASLSSEPICVKSTLVSVSSTSVSALRERLAGLQKKT